MPHPKKKSKKFLLKYFEIQSTFNMNKEIIAIRRTLLVFITLLVLSGLTAFPIRSEISFLVQHKDSFPLSFQAWIDRLKAAILNTPELMLYGTDWLAFAHLVIALFFTGVYIDPVRNKFIIAAGLMACAGIVPLAFIMGPARGIPFFHQLIDCSFGILGAIPLFIILKKINQLEHATQTH